MMTNRLLLVGAAVLCGAANAQSSVTIFGIVDNSLSYGRGSEGDVTQLLRGGYKSSRLGFRGVEDLGGGLKAGFWLEAGLNTDDGAGQATNTNNQRSGSGSGGALTFNRRSTVQLSGPWGELRLGRDYNPHYRSFTQTDVFGLNGVGTPVNFKSAITAPFTARSSNAITYDSPRFAGAVRFSVSHFRGENLEGSANEKDGTGGGMRVWYEKGPAYLAFGWGRNNFSTGDLLQRNIGAAWNFGVASVSGYVNSDRVGARSARGGDVGVDVPVKTGRLRASYSFHGTNDAGDPESRQLAVGYVHHLSKRTHLYATAAHMDNKNGAKLSLNGAVTGPSRSSSGFDLGVSHNF